MSGVLRSAASMPGGVMRYTTQNDMLTAFSLNVPYTVQGFFVCKAYQDAPLGGHGVTKKENAKK
ncbi:MAG: hypothetical protein LBD20_02320 [Spirochaetaceae bacterium]|nr:hypothetical protein [Spirochaetaceae bacterium]